MDPYATQQAITQLVEYSSRLDPVASAQTADFLIRLLDKDQEVSRAGSAAQGLTAMAPRLAPAAATRAANALRERLSESTEVEHLGVLEAALVALAPRLNRDDADRMARFTREAQVLASLNHPHIAAIYGVEDGAIVMELINGVNLAELIKAEGATGPEAALLVLKGSLLGLSAAHIMGVVHRDYKPGNVLVRGDGVSKLAGFGIAVRAGDDAPAAGTPAYMAPEQWRGNPVTPATDVYAATAVFYECLTGERPFPAKTLPQLAVAHRNAPIPVRLVLRRWIRSTVVERAPRAPVRRLHTSCIHRARQVSRRE